MQRKNKDKIESENQLPWATMKDGKLIENPLANPNKSLQEITGDTEPIRPEIRLNLLNRSAADFLEIKEEFLEEVEVDGQILLRIKYPQGK